MPKILKILKICLFWVLLMPILGMMMGVTLLWCAWNDISGNSDEIIP